MKNRIVIVDDSESTRLVVKMALAKFGVTIIEACDGKEAFELFDGRRIDLLITDYNMPHMNGAELIKSVRAIGNYSVLPIILLTGKIKDLKDEELTDDIEAWIQKPFMKADFLTKVGLCLKKSQVISR